MLKLRKVTFYFLYIEILDVITTIVGLYIGKEEANPLVYRMGWISFLFFKALVVLMVALVLERKKKFWFDSLVLLIAIIPVIWNAIVLFLEN